MIWQILLGVAIVILLLHWGSRNAVWGAATFGVIVGLVVAFFGDGFEWWTVGKALIIATFIGAALEWIPRIFQRKPGNR